ncbi:MAG: Antitoxin component of bacterial toxin-antitoxin system, MqsA [Moorella sp. (in: firmicutes)]|uniref:YgiT-type zinc finger domain protein n=1 Tax=Neomoorella thermoacetica TaxID=1525 RepID=A0A1J5NDF9_NEOTH|nr:Antitoxin component of bacterial toxin-antitoxin system, MqsA [Moorella sp. (in: firmicutes)]OIQ57049.1 hypothetical protein MOTE_22900 [Moorella thermoacetica]
MRERICRCGRPMNKEKRTVTRNIAGRKIVIKDVPVLYCDYCGEILYNARTVKKMDELIRKYPDQNLLIYPKPLEPTEDAPSFLKNPGEADEPIKLTELVSLISQLATQAGLRLAR